VGIAVETVIGISVGLDEGSVGTTVGNDRGCLLGCNTSGCPVGFRLG